MEADDFIERIIRRYVEMFRRPFFRWAMLVYIVVVMVFAIRIMPRLRNGDTPRIVGGAAIVDRLQAKLEVLEVRHVEQAKQLALISDQVKGLKTIPAAATSSGRLSVLSEQVAGLDRDLSSLKKALNPTRPDEVLTVARLGDKFEFLELQLTTISSKLGTFEAGVDAKIQRTYDQMNAQIDRIVDLFKWVGLLLLPIILNTIRDLVKGIRGQAS